MKGSTPHTDLETWPEWTDVVVQLAALTNFARGSLQEHGTAAKAITREANTSK